MILKIINILIIIFHQDLRGQLGAISVTSINQLYTSLQIPLVRHSGAFTDWLKFVPAASYHFYLLLFHIFFGIARDKSDTSHRSDTSTWRSLANSP